MTNMLAVPAVPLAPIDHHGKIRIARFDYAQVAEGAIGTIIELVKLPAGRVRLLGRESALYHNLVTATVDLDIGWAAHVDFNGAAVVADPDGLDADIDCETAGIITVGTVAAVLAECQSKVFESQEGVVINATVQTAVTAAADTLKGHIAYVLE